MSTELDNLEVQVSEAKGVMASAAALIQGIHDALIAAGTNPAKLNELANSLDESEKALAAAIAANPLPGEVVVPPVDPIEPE